MLWLKTMTYDNYELSHFNDCANGIAPKINEIEKFAKKIELNNEINQNSSFTFHKESGFNCFKDFNSHRLQILVKLDLIIYQVMLMLIHFI